MRGGDSTFDLTIRIWWISIFGEWKVESLHNWLWCWLLHSLFENTSASPFGVLELLWSQI